MKSPIIEFFERLILIIIFTGCIVLFWTLSKKIEYIRSPAHYAQKVLRVPQAGTSAAQPFKIHHALFSPDDDIKTTVIGLIDSEQEAITIAMYMFTDIDIAHALIRAYERGVKTQLIVDIATESNRFGKAALLARHHIPVFVYRPHSAPESKDQLISLMHNKFFVFSKNLQQKTLVCTGSYNCTKGASCCNQENFVCIEDSELAQAFLKQFEIIKQRARPY